MDKVVTRAPAALADVRDGSLLVVGRFGPCELAPEVTLDEVRAESDAEQLRVRDLMPAPAKRVHRGTI